MNKKLFIIIPAAVLILIIVLTLNLKGKVSFRPDVSRTPQAKTLLSQAKNLESQGNFLEAKKFYQQLLEEFPGSREIMNWQGKIEDLNITMLFSPIITPKSIIYEVKPGDSLDKIAKANKTTVELIMKSNGLNNEIIVPGQKIKVWIGKFNIFVDKSQNILILKTDEEVIKTYTVATGLNNSSPVGTFKIIEKIVNPPWYKPGGSVVPAGNPENILGSRWMGLDKKGYGIHGTTDPKSLGTQATAGCVRMANSDVEELFSIVPQGTEVTIVD